jgi:hypothetical protein
MAIKGFAHKKPQVPENKVLRVFIITIKIKFGGGGGN